MTDFPPQNSSESPIAVTLAYQTPPPYGNAPTLVKLAGIFSLVSAAFDLVQAAFGVGMAVVMHYTVANAPPPPPGAPAVPQPPLALFYAIYGTPAILCLVMLGFKIFGGIKLLRRGPHVWGWGLALAIMGCAEIWTVFLCCPMYLVPLGIGIYTLVILSLPNVRLFLRLGPTAEWPG